jgi:hypothetical protein
MRMLLDIAGHYEGSALSVPSGVEFLIAVTPAAMKGRGWR